MRSLVCSYTHADSVYRDEFEKHLGSLKHEGLIDVWYDGVITAGAAFDPEIRRRFETANIIALLVSSDFLSSGYILDIEMRHAMARHETGQALVVPVIVRPCDWHTMPFGKLKALPRDGRAVTSWSNQDEAWTNVAKELRRCLGERDMRASRSRVASPRSPASGQAHALQLPRTYSQEEKDDFLEESFQQLKKEMQGLLAELARRNAGVNVKIRDQSSERFAVQIYRAGRELVKCTVSLVQADAFGNGILFSYDGAGSNSFNEKLYVEADAQGPYLRGIVAQSWRDSLRFSAEDGASLFVDMLVRRIV